MDKEAKSLLLNGYLRKIQHLLAKDIIIPQEIFILCSLFFVSSRKIMLKRISNGLSLYIPSGFAHSYLSLDKENIVYYKLSNYYHPEYESGIIWNDTNIKVNWPIKKPKVSRKDKGLDTFRMFCKKFRHL